MSITTGTRLGPYEILATIGAGGMGQVYRARDSRLDRDVAVKVLPENHVSDSTSLARFEREAKAVAALSHPNILAIHDVGREGSAVFIVMELLEGETLRNRIDAAPISSRKALEWALQIAQGLGAAHDRGIVHRDLKPQNVFLTRDGNVKLLDFGLAAVREPLDDIDKTVATRPARTGPDITHAGTILGTVGYMSPEQVRSASADHRADIFSLGILLFEMLTGERAFRRPSDVETMMAILREDPFESSAAGRALPPDLRELVAHCLEKNPEERFQSARDLAFALKVADGRSSGSTRMESGAFPSASRPSLVMPPPKENFSSIAVLPFRNLSADRDQDYFSDGITEEIITALTRIGSLRVASRTSAFAFKGKDEDVRKIGATLGVRTVLEGSVRQSGKRIRISAQLIGVADGYHLWSERYDREMEDVFEVQDEISQAIAEALKVRLGPAEQTPRGARGTEDVDAYDQYLKGRYHFNRREAQEATAEFERALARDPLYAAAWTGLADAQGIHAFYGGLDTREAFSKARRAAERGHELAPDSADSHVSLGIVEHYFGWNFRKEEAEFRRATELAPNSGTAWSWLGQLLGYLGRPAEAHEAASRAVELEPHSANARTNYAWTFYASRRFEEAAREMRSALAIDPHAPYPLWGLGVVAIHLGRGEEAVVALETAVEVTKVRPSHYLGLLGGAYAVAGRRDDAMAILGELEDRASREYVAPFHLAFLHVPMGNRDEAMACLHRACDERNALAWWPRASPYYDALRDHPEFPGLLAKIVPA